MKIKSNLKCKISHVLGITRSQQGFTLIELLVVIAIIGILTSVLMVNFIGVRQRARDAQRKTTMKQLQSAFELYRSDNGKYPCFTSDCTSTTAGTMGNSTLKTTLSTYLSDDAADPLYTAACPNYLITTNGSNYTIFAQLENVNDAEATIDKKAPVVNAGSYTCTGGTVAGKCKVYTSSLCTGTYNYWVNNP